MVMKIVPDITDVGCVAYEIEVRRLEKQLSKN